MRSSGIGNPGRAYPALLSKSNANRQWLLELKRKHNLHVYNMDSTIDVEMALEDVGVHIRGQIDDVDNFPMYGEMRYW